MSGIEIVGVAASVLQIADLGARVSAKLFGFARKIRGAAEKIDLISKEIAATGALLQQLGQQLDKDSNAQLLRRELVESANELVQDCKKIFRNIDKAIDGNSGNKIILSLKQKIHYAYLESEIEALRANLENLKSSIGIMQNILIYAEQLRNRERFPVLKEQQDLLKALGEEKLANEQRYNTLMKAIQDRSASEPLPPSPSPDPRHSQGQPETHMAFATRSVRIEPQGSIQSTAQDGTQKSFKPNQSFKHNIALNDGEMQDYVSLVAHMLEEVHSKQYKLEQSMRSGVHNGVLDLHWQEWAPLRQFHVDEVLLQKFKQLPEIVKYWTQKIKDKGESDQRLEDPNTTTSKVTVRAAEEKELQMMKPLQRVSTASYLHPSYEFPRPMPTDFNEIEKEEFFKADKAADKATEKQTPEAPKKGHQKIVLDIAARRQDSGGMRRTRARSAGRSVSRGLECKRRRLRRADESSEEALSEASFRPKRPIPTEWAATEEVEMPGVEDSVRERKEDSGIVDADVEIIPTQVPKAFDIDALVLKWTNVDVGELLQGHSDSGY
jgi:hypothetical protein